jgi:hypothetical protein
MSTVSTVTADIFAQLCLDLHKKINEPNALLAKFKAAHAVATASDANGSNSYDAFTSTTTHHLHNLSFHGLQEINTTEYDNIVGPYV